MQKESDIINDNDINNDDSDNDDGTDNVDNDDGDDDDKDDDNDDDNDEGDDNDDDNDDGLTCYQSLVTNKFIIFIFNLFFDCIYIIITHFVDISVRRL